MDVTQALRDVENALRDFIAHTLEKAFGAEWEKQCGVSTDRLEQWHERQKIEEKRQQTGVVEERLLYYADFYDLGTILHKNWSQHFSEALGEWKTMEVFLNELGKLRDPDAHRRELLPHQKHLAIGISGEIRTRITRFRSSQETGESYFPRIESVRDSLGTIWTYGMMYPLSSVKRVFVGDTIDFVITASDPLGEPLLYFCDIYNSAGISNFQELGWSENNSFSVTFDESHIGLRKDIFFFIKSRRKYHAHNNQPFENDDCIIFLYDVIPPRTG